MWDGLPTSSHCSYIIEEGICYLALCEEAYPSQLAFSYLENLHTEFIQQHGHEVYKAQRPYYFIEFGKYDTVFIGGALAIFVASHLVHGIELYRADLT